MVVTGTNYEIQRTASPEAFTRTTHVQETAPGLKSPYLGAFTGNQVTQTIDGLKFSNALFRTGPNQYYSWIPDAFVQEISVSDGGNVGGTIDRMLGIAPSHIAVNFNSALGFTATASFKERQIGVALSNIDLGDVRTAQGTIPHSAYNQQALMVQAAWTAGQKTTLMRTHSRDLERTDKWNGGIRASGVQVPAIYTWERQDYTLLKHEAKVGALNLSAGYQQFEEHIRDGTKPIASELNSYTLNADYSLGRGFSVYTTNTREDITYDNGVAVSTSNPQRIDQDTWWNFKQGVRWLGLINALRVVASAGYKEVTAGNVADFHNAEGSLNVGYAGFFAGYDRSTNTPSYFSLKQSLTSGKGISLPNANLKEEYADTIRVGYKSGALYVDVYEKHFRNAIQTQTVTSNPLVYRPYNGGAINVFGGALGYANPSLRGSKFGLDARGEYTYGRNQLPTGAVQPTDKTTTFLGYLRLNHGPIWSEFVYQPKVTRLSPSDLNDVRVFNHNGGYQMVNIGYNWTCARRWTGTVALNNLFNDAGRVLGSSVDVPARSVVVSVRLFF